MQVGSRVQIPPYTDRWMMGDRYGVVTKLTPGVPRVRNLKAGVTMAHVRLDKSGKTVRCIARDCEEI